MSATKYALSPPIEKALLRFYQELDRRIFTKPQQAILRTVRRRSLDRGLPECWIPQLKYFVWDHRQPGDRLDKAEASRALNELVKMRVLLVPEIEGKPRTGWYAINVLFDTWNVPEKKSDPFADQMWLELDEPELDDALRENFIECGGDNPPSMPQGSRACGTSHQGPAQSDGVRDTDSESQGEAAAGPLVKPITGRPGENGSPPAEWPANQALGNSQPLGKSQQQPECWEIPNTPNPGACPGVGKFPTTSARANVDRGKTAVGKIPTVAENSASVGAEKVFPPTPPLSKALNVERSTLNAQRGVGKSGKIVRERVTPSEEKLVMEMLEEWLGAEEMKHNGGMWRVRWVRNCANLVASEIKWGKYLEETGSPDKPRTTRAAWLMYTLCKINGVRNVNHMPIGPVPTT